MQPTGPPSPGYMEDLAKGSGLPSQAVFVSVDLLLCEEIISLN